MSLTCDGCGTTSDDVRLVEVENPDGLITTCPRCEGNLNSEIVAEKTEGGDAR